MASSSESLVFLYKFIEHEAKINIEILRDILVILSIIARTIGILSVALDELGRFDSLASASRRHCNTQQKN